MGGNYFEFPINPYFARKSRPSFLRSADLPYPGIGDPMKPQNPPADYLTQK